ncbi:MAG TPA: nuclear transport factor 2 family protein [Myxococcota bacterium]|nr:nuclear transport factor 2 family protein [Myxococcota bacterium]
MTNVAPLAPHDLDEIRGHLRTWARCGVEGRWDDLVEILTDDVQFLPPDHPIVQGKEAVASWLLTFPPISAFVTELDEARGGPQLAWTRGHFGMTVGPGVSVRGKWVATWRRGDDGRWRCATDIWNADRPMA